MREVGANYGVSGVRAKINVDGICESWAGRESREPRDYSRYLHVCTCLPTLGYLFMMRNYGGWKEMGGYQPGGLFSFFIFQILYIFFF